MKIALYIFSLLITLGAFAQNEESQSRISTNAEASRSAITPCSSTQAAAADYQGAKRYAIALGGWEQQQSELGAEFASSFILPFSWIGRQAYLSIESASAPYIVSVGGQEVGRVYNAAMRAEFEVARYLEREVPVLLTITLLRDEQTSQLEGWGSDTLALGAITMLSQPTMYIRDIEVETVRRSGVLNATIALVVKSEALNPRTSRINYELLTPHGGVATRGFSDVKLDMRREDTLYVFAVIPDSLAWSIDSPNMYRLNLSTQYRSRYLEYISFDLGLRSVELSQSGALIVNGVEQQLRGIEVQPSIEVEELAELKSEGYNFVRLAAGEYNPEIYKYADRNGLYLMPTAPINTEHSGADILVGGNPTNDPNRVDEYLERVDAIYHITRNHSSVVAYSLADRSLNGYNLYEGYLYLKQRETQRPIIYEGGAGEWNSDHLQVAY